MNNKDIEYITAKNKYGLYCVPKSSSHRGGARTILEGGVWEQDTIDFIVKHAKNDIVHAGTYFGDMLPVFSKHFDKVWAFEPLVENFYCASKTVEWNNLKNVNLSNFGLSDKQETVDFVIEKKKKSLGGGCHILQPGDVPTGKTTKIQTITIDSVIPKDSNISIIQLDVENNEFAALRGADKTIERCNPILIIEKWKRRPMSADLKNWLKQRGYKFHCNLHGVINDVWIK